MTEEDRSYLNSELVILLSALEDFHEGEDIQLALEAITKYVNNRS